jgi:hypothetical protein
MPATQLGGFHYEAAWDLLVGLRGGVGSQWSEVYDKFMEVTL